MADLSITERIVKVDAAIAALDAVIDACQERLGEPMGMAAPDTIRAVEEDAQEQQNVLLLIRANLQAAGEVEPLDDAAGRLLDDAARKFDLRMVRDALAYRLIAAAADVINATGSVRCALAGNDPTEIKG